MNNDCIAAISTAPAAGGVAIIRISGADALGVAEKMFSPSGRTRVMNFKPRYMYSGNILADGGITDFGLCVYFKAPHSFTGEDVVELHCHGGVELSRAVLKAAVSNGARPAKAGEFTMRAFINGKISLSAAEGMADMINGESTAEVRAGSMLYSGRLTKEAQAVQSELTDILAKIGADVDYPEEDIERTELSDIKDRLSSLRMRLETLASSYDSGKKIKNGVSVAICGKPNAGKSSLLNAFLGYDKAIVSSSAGTTRDVVEGTLEIEGVNFRITDTAGLRESADAIEREGVRRAREAMKGADVIVWLKEDGEVPEFPEGTPVITVGAKSDLARREDCDIVLSSYTGEGLDALRRLLYERGFGRENDGAFLLSERHYRAAQAAHEAVKEALASAEGGLPPELYAEDIRRAWETLGTLSGETASEAIVTEIFEKFCVGK